MEAYKFKLKINVIEVSYIVHRCMVGDVRIVRVLNWNGDKWFSDVKMPTDGVHCYFLVAEDGSIANITTILPLSKDTFKLHEDNALRGLRNSAQYNLNLNYWDITPIQVPEPIYV